MSGKHLYPLILLTFIMCVGHITASFGGYLQGSAASFTWKVLLSNLCLDPSLPFMWLSIQISPQSLVIPAHTCYEENPLPPICLTLFLTWQYITPVFSCNHYSFTSHLPWLELLWEKYFSVFLLFKVFFICTYVCLPEFMCVTCIRSLWEPGESIRSAGTKVACNCDLLCGAGNQT